MFNIAICDDDDRICSQIDTVIHNYCAEIDIQINIDIFNTGEALLNYFKNGIYYDLVFLDIQLATLDGISVGKYVREVLNIRFTEIVFISSSESYLRDLFEIRPQNFLLKPLDKSSIIKELKKAVKNTSLISHSFVYKLGNDTCKIESKDILYFESILRKVKMVTVDREVVFYEKFNSIYDALKNSGFFYIHRSFIVNFAHVKVMGYERVILSNDEELVISKTMRKSVRHSFIQYEKGVGPFD